MNGLRAASLGQRAMSLQMRRHWYCTSTAPKKSVIAAKHPFKAELEAAKRYSWCACGHSRKQTDWLAQYPELESWRTYIGTFLGKIPIF
uniref:CDGSH iron-sulfur domain-containing protein 3, mitochondrial-like isoform X3 n=1 Tax=Pristiophorus japonicus TaxID=55135 RepID=UPI00398E3F20